MGCSCISKHIKFDLILIVDEFLFNLILTLCIEKQLLDDIDPDSITSYHQLSKQRCLHKHF